MKNQVTCLLVSLLMPLSLHATVFEENDLMAKTQASGSDAPTMLQQLWLVPSGKKFYCPTNDVGQKRDVRLRVRKGRREAR